MNQCVNEQMATRERAEKLSVDHMCDPCEWMPISLAKSGKRPAHPRERNTAIHYWVLFDIRNVIENDEAMPDDLRVNAKRDYRQTEQNEEIGSLECRNVADLERLRGSPVGCDRVDSILLLRGPSSHAVCETIR